MVSCFQINWVRPPPLAKSYSQLPGQLLLTFHVIHRIIALPTPLLMCVPAHYVLCSLMTGGLIGTLRRIVKNEAGGSLTTCTRPTLN